MGRVIWGELFGAVIRAGYLGRLFGRVIWGDSDKGRIASGAVLKGFN